MSNDGAEAGKVYPKVGGRAVQCLYVSEMVVTSGKGGRSNNSQIVTILQNQQTSITARVTFEFIYANRCKQGGV